MTKVVKSININKLMCEEKIGYKIIFIIYKVLMTVVNISSLLKK